MKFAFVNSNLVNLWSEPRFNSERASQCFFGEAVRVLNEKAEYCQIEQTDGYKGWVRTSFLIPTGKTEFAAYLQSCRFVVVTKAAKVFDPRTGRSVEPYLLYYGTKIAARSGSGDAVKVRLGKSFVFSVKKAHLKPINRAVAASVTGTDLVTEARKFLGVPYLWGGVTSVGFDCSGFVRTVLSVFNLYVPRDTKDQIYAGQEVERECIKRGDLLFFNRHVGFALGNDRLIHASAAGNGVRINSLRPGESDYREDLDREFVQARRIL